MNIFYPPYQGYVFLLMSVVGLTLGIVYDIFKIKRKLFGTTFIFLFIDDFLFMIIASVVFLFGVFALNNGIVRWYELAFCICGFVVYRLTVSKIVMIVFGYIINIIHRVFKMILGILVKPLMVFLKPLNVQWIYFSEIFFINNWIKKLSPVGK